MITVKTAPRNQRTTPVTRVANSRHKAGTMLLRFWGVRGSLSTPGNETIRYGGNTPCVELRCGKTLIILDAGTGIRSLGEALLREFGERRIVGHILINHEHRDHIEGLRFFEPALDPRHSFTVYGSDDAMIEVEDEFATQLETKFFPATAEEIGIEASFQPIDVGRFFINDVAVTAIFLNHPGICYGYRLEWSGRTLVYLSDTEPYSSVRALEDDGEINFETNGALSNHLDSRLAKFAQGAELLICDAQYDAKEYRQKRGWGHSSVDDAVRIALTAQVKRLALFHHDPSHDDEKLDAMLTHARQLLRRRHSSVECFAAQEGLELLL